MSDWEEYAKKQGMESGKAYELLLNEHTHAEDETSIVATNTAFVAVSIAEKEMRDKYASALLSLYDYLKIVDNEIIKEKIEIGMLTANEETLSEMLFRKMKAYNIDLNKDLDFTHLKPVTNDATKKEE